MSESDTVTARADLDVLEALQADAPKLVHLENLLDRYNVFETIGFDKDEEMHSNFLALLFNPKRNDGLGDQFLKEVLREALANAHRTLPSSMSEGFDKVFENLDDMDLRQTNVQREHRDIDILLTSETHKLAVIIENKVLSTEHSRQLDKYVRIVRYSHPDWDILKIYLTPKGAAPSHKEYVSFSYAAICNIVDCIVKNRDSALDSDIQVSMEHYAEMVRRRILGDPEIVKLSQQIYWKHKRALDLIHKHRPDFRAQTRPIVEELIRGQREHPELEQESSSLDTIRFAVKDWDEKPKLRTAEGWTSTKRILLFIVYNRPISLDLHLYMGPGPDLIRQKIINIAGENPEVLLMPSNAKPKWISIYHRPLLKQEAYQELDDEQRKQKIHRQWEAFLDKDLPQIEAALKKQTWIWDQ
jgi:hypothetical protein